MGAYVCVYARARASVVRFVVVVVLVVVVVVYMYEIIYSCTTLSSCVDFHIPVSCDMYINDNLNFCSNSYVLAYCWPTVRCRRLNCCSLRFHLRFAVSDFVTFS